MAFEVVELAPKQVKQASISYMRYTRKGQAKKGSLPRLVISVPSAIAAVGKRKHFQLTLGTAGDKGKARLVGQNAANGCTVQVRELKYAMVFNFGFLPALGNEIADKEPLVVRKVNDDVFEFDLPAWWK